VMNPAAEGTRYPDVAFTVDPARVAAFRDLFGQREGVPPTFATAAEFAVLPRIVDDPALDLDLSRVVHGSQDYVFERPLREGETLTIRARLDLIRVRGGNGFLTIVTEMLDPEGRAVCTGRSTMIERAPDA
jgi:acyl dehydratase